MLDKRPRRDRLLHCVLDSEITLVSALAESSMRNKQPVVVRLERGCPFGRGLNELPRHPLLQLLPDSGQQDVWFQVLLVQQQQYQPSR